MADKTIVASFMIELMGKARYGIKGEKPLALIATLKYLHENGVVGVKFLDLLTKPHIRAIRSFFLELAREHSPIREPATSWDVITGKTRELQGAIRQFRSGDVNLALANLNPEEIEALLHTYTSRF